MAKKKTSTVNKAAASTRIEPRRPTPPPKPSRVRGWFTGPAIRETIESVTVAFVLAFLFRAFDAEAFVIPTGSMAPTLMGQHKDLLCPKCGYRYQVGASSESEDMAAQRGQAGATVDVVLVTCPMCRYTTSVDPRTDGGREYPTYGGDRIVVNKVAYEFAQPRRWDVMVFKCPYEAQTNYIKRLVGLPRETVRIWHGDLYFKADGEVHDHLERRGPLTLRAMAQIVYDNDYLIDLMTEKGWPLRWQPWPEADPSAAGAWTTSDGSRSYSVDGSAGDVRWLGYQHFVPSIMDWELLKRESLPEGYRPRPRLITDFCAYNTGVPRGGSVQPQMLGLHWVGDLMVECQLELTRPEGTAVVELIKGGRHFRCDLDCQSGQARLSIDGVDDYRPTAQTAVRGQGSHRVALANIDNQLVLWIDGSPVEFDSPTSYEPLDNDKPKSDAQDPGDLLPARIGSQGAGLRVSHLRLWRDLYYIATSSGGPLSDYDQPVGSVPGMSYEQLLAFWSTPSQWEPSGGASPFDDRREAVFPLEADQFFALGDNSPVSGDARLWPHEKYVSRELLMGKALFIFWPHSFDQVPGTKIPLPFFPNFARMRFIR
jgi:signal peptidase I